MTQRIRFDAYFPEEMVIVFPHKYGDWEYGVEYTSEGIQTTFAPWVSEITIMPKKSYECETAWRCYELQGRNSHRRIISVKRAFSKREYELDKEVVESYGSISKGFDLLDRMPFIEKAAIEAVWQKVNHNLISKFIKYMLYNEDEIAYFLMCYEKTLRDEIIYGELPF